MVLRFARTKTKCLKCDRVLCLQTLWSLQTVHQRSESFLRTFQHCKMTLNKLPLLCQFAENRQSYCYNLNDLVSASISQNLQTFVLWMWRLQKWVVEKKRENWSTSLEFSFLVEKIVSINIVFFLSVSVTTFPECFTFIFPLMVLVKCDQAVSGAVGGGRHELVPSVCPQASPLLWDTSSEGWDRPADRGLHPQPPGLEFGPHRRGDGPERVS